MIQDVHLENGLIKERSKYKRRVLRVFAKKRSGIIVIKISAFANCW